MGNAGYIGNGSVGLWMMGWLLVMTGSGFGEMLHMGLEVNSGVILAVGEEIQVEGVDDEVRHRGVLLAWALAMVLGGLFVVMFLMAVARSGRFFRRHHRIGVKEKPTEYIDAWSQYRLKDQDWKEAYEDEG